MVVGDWAHVAVGQLVPSTRESISKLCRILVESLRNFQVGRIFSQCNICSRHHGRVALVRVVRIRHRISSRAVGGLPLVGSCWALGKLPLVTKKRIEIAVIPLNRGRRPGALKSRGDGVLSFSGAEAVGPSEPLLLDRGTLWLWPNVSGVSGSVGFTKGVSSGYQCYGFFVVHRHAGKGLANVTSRRNRVWLTVRPLRVHVDKPHLNSRKRIVELTVTLVTLVAQPLGLWPPVNISFGLEYISAPPRETKGVKAHSL